MFAAMAHAVVLGRLVTVFRVVTDALHRLITAVRYCASLSLCVGARRPAIAVYLRATYALRELRSESRTKGLSWTTHSLIAGLNALFNAYST